MNRAKSFPFRSTIFVLSVLGASLITQIFITLPADAETLLNANTKNIYSQTLKIPVHIWPHTYSVKPKAVVVALHSFLLDGSRYSSLARHLNEKQILVLAPDIRGFGKWLLSPVESSRRTNYVQSVVDVENLLNLLHSKYPDTPIICIGESMGSNLLVSVASHNRSHMSGLVLSSPCTIKKRTFLKPRALFDLTLTLLKPWREVNLIPYFESYTGVPDNVKIDEYTRKSMNALDLIRTVKMLSRSLRKADTIPSDLPVLVIQGKSDRLCQKGKVNNLVSRVTSKEKEVIVVQGGGHLFLESSSTQNIVAQTVEQWILTKLKSTNY